MIEVYVLAGVALFAAGAVLGYLIVVSMAIHREEADLSMTTPTSSRILSGARAANGVYVLSPGIINEVRLSRQELLR